MSQIDGTDKIAAVCGGLRYEIDTTVLDPGTTFFIPAIRYRELATMLDEVVVIRREAQSIEFIATPTLTPEGYGVRVIIIRAPPAAL